MEKFNVIIEIPAMDDLTDILSYITYVLKILYNRRNWKNLI